MPPYAEPPAPANDAAPRLQMWGGVECSVLRVAESWRDQLRETGHHDRPADLEAVAALGVRRMRYPALWERVAPDRPEEQDWTWEDARLAELRRLGIAPVLGLVHHGGGPRYTDLADPAFPRKLAAHAAAAARRYPWVTDWTPVNEPLTTARFAGLYGHWWPHAADEAAFLRMVVNQCLGVVLAMRAIRREIPGARLVQTEDLGRTFATRPLAHQAAYENERRWISLDLLCGKVDRAHPWWGRLLGAGVARPALECFLAEDLRPMLLGWNLYATSERFLDHRLALHPRHLHGGNGRQAYADTEAVRVPLPPGEATGWLPRLREAWARYRRPMAITEAHLGCEVAEQLRWLAETWHAAETLRAEGGQLEAVTAWAMFGAVDWCSLLRARRGRYEPGAFDAPPGCARARPTALAEAVAGFAREGRFEHEWLAEPGWWRRPERLFPRLVAAA